VRLLQNNIQNKSEVQLRSEIQFETASKLVERNNENKVNKVWNKKVHNDRTVTNKKPEKIIRENENGSCMLIEVAILGESDIFTFPVKGIKRN